MIGQFITNSRPLKKWGLFSGSLIFFLCFTTGRALAHQSPTTIVLLDVSPDKVAMELQLPVPELALAFGHDITRNPETVVERLGPQLTEYLRAHIHPYVTKGSPWLVEVVSMQMDKGVQAASGPPYWEVVAHLVLHPQPGETTRQFMLDYDVIMHQVINHVAFVSIRNDWETGNNGKQPTEAGVISWNVKDNVIYPLQINLEKGNWWKGCVGMLQLGMQHIKEGTDHLLFLIVLLLPVMLVTNGKRWAQFGGVKYSVVRLLKIVTAFTIGHSITLLIGALGWVRLPVQPVEVLIAFSILVSAVHAVVPVFYGKEIYVAAGFGLVHGLAFAAVLFNLQLNTGAMALSILSFNIGIEFMQLVVIAITVPWLILLSRTSFYAPIRITGAAGASVAALAWITERVTGEANSVSAFVQQIAGYAPWAIALLAVISLALYFFPKSKKVGFI